MSQPKGLTLFVFRWAQEAISARSVSISSPMHDRVACSAKRNEVLLCVIPGVATQFSVVNLEMRQRAATLAPVAVADNGQTGHCARLDDRESQDVERFVGMPAELGALDAHKIDAVGHLGTRITGRFG